MLKNRYMQANLDDVAAADTSAGTDDSTTPTWPEDWREKYAKGDDKKLAHLTRYTSPDAAFDAGLAAQNKIRSGEATALSPFPTEGKDEEKASWRKDRGIPESFDKYDIGLKDDEKEKAESFLKMSHESNLSPDQAKIIRAWNQEDSEAKETAITEKDKVMARETQDALHAEWGSEFRGNINRIEALLSTFGGEEMNDVVRNARTQDGTALFSDIRFIKMMANMALELNPGTVVVPSGGDQQKSIKEAMEDLEKMMGDHTSDYWKGPKSEGLQARYRDLIEANDKLAKRP